MHAPIDPALANPADYPPAPFDRFLVRPSLEPIVYSSWNRFERWNIDGAWALEITSALTGRQARYRPRPSGQLPAVELPAGIYAPLEHAALWLEAVDAVRDRSDLTPLQAASLVHAIVTVYHPMADGNGRLARALFHGVLRSRTGIDAPFLALGPVSYALTHHRLALFRRLTRSGDWAAYLDGAYHFVTIAIANQELLEDDDALESFMANPRA